MTLLIHDLMHDLIALLAEPHHLQVAAPACEARETCEGVSATVTQRLGGHSLVVSTILMLVKSQSI